MDRATALFEAERPRLIALCYRMLGERAAAEDAVQDTWLRWAEAAPDDIAAPAAWLTRVATRISMDALRSARVRRERYVGPWLPEPLVTTTEQPVEDQFVQAQECGLAMLWAMERLDPVERAALILREAFDADYAEVAEVLGKSEAACRQLVSRARKRVSGVARFAPARAQVEAVMGRFYAAAAAQDFEAVKRLLAPDAVALSDGGAKVRAARRPLVGPAEIAQVTLSVLEKYLQMPDWTMRPCVANGAPALLCEIGGRVDSVITMLPDAKGTVAWLYTMRAPEKLQKVRGA